MLRQSIQAATPELKEFVENLINEESRLRFKDRRSVGREPLTKAVTIELRDQQSRSLPAITRDISGIGIGLVSNEPVEPYITARILIDRIKGRPSSIIAECRWCEECSNGWYMSGWHFVSIETA